MKTPQKPKRISEIFTNHIGLNEVNKGLDEFGLNLANSKLEMQVEKLNRIKELVDLFLLENQTMTIIQRDGIFKRIKIEAEDCLDLKSQ